MPLQLRANPKSKAKGKDSKGKGEGKDVKGKDKGKDANERILPKKAKNDDQRKWFCCNKSGHVKAECRKRLKDLAEAEGKPVAATPHPYAPTVVPLQSFLPDERHVNVHHSHALCEQRNVMPSHPVNKR